MVVGVPGSCGLVLLAAAIAAPACKGGMITGGGGACRGEMLGLTWIGGLGLELRFRPLGPDTTVMSGLTATG